MILFVPQKSLTLIDISRRSKVWNPVEGHTQQFRLLPVLARHCHTQFHQLLQHVYEQLAQCSAYPGGSYHCLDVSSILFVLHTARQLLILLHQHYCMYMHYFYLQQLCILRCVCDYALRTDNALQPSEAVVLHYSSAHSVPSR